MGASQGKVLKVVLIAVGLVFTFAVYPLGLIWPSGWCWGGAPSYYLTMIEGLYAVLGIFLLMASRDPMRHRSLIWFTVCSSVVHGAIMTVQAWGDPTERGHFIADIPALFIVAIVLAVLMPRRQLAVQH